MKELVEAITNDSEGGIAGLDANGNASEYMASLNGNEDAIYYNVSREVNYEINQTTTQIEQAKGQIEDISVSVILNSRNTDNYIMIRWSVGEIRDKNHYQHTDTT